MSLRKTCDLLVRETDADPHASIRQSFPVLFGEMPENRDNAPAHGGVCGAGNPCLARCASPRNLARDHHRELRPVAHESAEIFDRRRADVCGIERLGDGQATRLVEEREFAENVTGAKHRERRFPTVFGDPIDAHVTGFQQIDRVPEVALMEDHVIWWIVGFAEKVGDVLYFVE